MTIRKTQSEAFVVDKGVRELRGKTDYLKGILSGRMVDRDLGTCTLFSLPLSRITHLVSRDNMISRPLSLTIAFPILTPRYPRCLSLRAEVHLLLYPVPAADFRTSCTVSS